MHPHRYEVLKKLVDVARSNRQDLIERISQEIKVVRKLRHFARVWGRENIFTRSIKKNAHKGSRIPLYYGYLCVPCDCEKC